MPTHGIFTVDTLSPALGHLVLTADEPPCDIYNPFLYNISGATRPNSVTTACFTSRDGSASAKLHELLRQASGFFMTGGDQQKYESFWKGTPVAAALSSPPAGAVAAATGAARRAASRHAARPVPVALRRRAVPVGRGARGRAARRVGCPPRTAELW